MVKAFTIVTPGKGTLRLSEDSTGISSLMNAKINKMYLKPFEKFIEFQKM